jgi:hypothetical protein
MVQSLIVQLALPQELHCRAFGFSFAPHRTQTCDDGFLPRVVWYATNVPRAAKTNSTLTQEPV